MYRDFNKIALALALAASALSLAIYSGVMVPMVFEALSTGCMGSVEDRHSHFLIRGIHAHALQLVTVSIASLLLWSCQRTTGPLFVLCSLALGWLILVSFVFVALMLTNCIALRSVVGG